MLKRLLTLTICFFLTAFTLTNTPAEAKPDFWAPVHQYIEDHATYVAPTTEERLYAEAVLGIRTWVVFGDSAPAAKALIHGEGWPSTGQVILFATAEEAHALEALVQAATVED